ncbi:alpha-N-acetylglucosaminidase isoform X1 [Lucilia cuprina]|uniref:alpha-N-acetylglucosaminidase isoform X1 n=1 Tax=Lucilia cuprina TaxID=7375 RepID=UPI001F065D29|nr:alpha-N-acetylglucosaminidase isoform X1 [Lucilia cuprina]
MGAREALVSVFFIYLSHSLVFAAQIPKQLINETPKETQLKAVRELVHRTLLEKDLLFEIDINKNLEFRSFQIYKTTTNKIVIIGYDGVSAAKGFNHYLKYFLHKTIYWYNKHIYIEDGIELPYVNITSKSSSSVIYYQNVCTWGYSFVWWNWSKWVEHIDWMAMMGISLTIAPIQEQLWYETYLEMGLTEDEIDMHISGPAFLPWLRMGNIRGWGGTLGPTYRRMQMILQQKIIQQQRSLGMIVALPSFSGHLPVAMKNKYPTANFSIIDRWNKFPNSFCCGLFLDPIDPLFQNITTMFLKKVVSNYGTDHIYFADPFNEVQPRIADASYLNMTAYHIYNSMHIVDNKAIWLLQGWMFVKNIFWSDKLIKAFLTAVPTSGLLVLDLQSEQFPQYERTHSFYGHYFIWCMLHNFGGTLGMHGSVDVINRGIRTARTMTNSSMIGVGITPEGINQNYVMYALTLERAWLKDDINLTDWFNVYADVQYGIVNNELRNAWQLLRNSVYSYYSFKKIRGKYVIARRPSTRINVWTWYNSSDIYESWSKLLQLNGTIPNNHYNIYKNDLVDITRQFLQVTAERIYVNLIQSFKKKQNDQFLQLSQIMINIFDDLDLILSTHENYLLGTWLESAKNLATTTKEREQFEFNARNQITLWGPSGQIVDYATKQWSGIVRDFFKPRWQLFLKQLNISLNNNIPFNNTMFIQTVLTEIEKPFSYDKKRYHTLPNGNTYTISQRIFTMWSEFFLNKDYVNYLLPVDIKKIKD